MTLNLVQHRAADNVWNRTNRGAEWEIDRWMAAVLAGGLIVSGVRRQSAPGFLLVLGGSALAWWAAGGRDERSAQLGRLRVAWRRSAADGDAVHEAAEESFPASDAPSWTPTTGNSAGPCDTARPR